MPMGITKFGIFRFIGPVLPAEVQAVACDMDPMETTWDL